MPYSRSSAFICGLIIFVSAAFAQTRTVTDAEVQKVHKSALLIDTHNDITSRTVDGFDIGTAKNDGHTNLTALQAKAASARSSSPSTSRPATSTGITPRAGRWR